MQSYEILRPISGLEAHPGDIVDVSEWTSVRELERQGYIRRALSPSPSMMAATLARKGGRDA